MDSRRADVMNRHFQGTILKCSKAWLYSTDTKANTTNVVSAELKRREPHFYATLSNLFTLNLIKSDDLDSVESLLVNQIGKYAIPLKKAVSVLILLGELNY